MTKRLSILLLLSLAACQGPSDPASRGKAYFVGLGCKTCHAVGLDGGQVGPDLTYVGFRKTPEWIDVKLQDPAAWRPSSPMPDFKLQPPVREALVAYLASLKGEAYRHDPPWDGPGVKDDPVKRGETIYNRVGCVGCHGVAGVGGFPNNNVTGGMIPSLKLVADGFSKDELKERIRSGRKSDPADAAAPPPMIAMPAWGETLKEDELDALVDYLYSLRPPRSAAEEW